MKLAKAYSGTQSVVRALRLLKLFHGARPSITFAQIQERSGLNRSTAFRMLTALEAEGMIERHPGNEGYRLGPQIAALGEMATVSGGVADLARSEMVSLAKEVGTTVVLGLKDGDEIVVVGDGELPKAATEAHAPGSMPSVAGGVPAHASSIGKVLLSSFSEEERAAILACGLPPLTPITLTDMGSLQEDLQRTLDRGYALSLEELELNFQCVAVPIHDAQGKVIAALGTGGSKQEFPVSLLEQLSETLKEASASITRELGGVQYAVAK